MANDFWNFVTRFTRRTVARAEAVNTTLLEIKTAWDLLPALARLREQRVSYSGVDTGAVNAYVVTPPYAVTLTDGAEVTFKPLVTNTTASTVNVYALGALPMVDYAGNALTGGEAAAATFVTLRYNSTNAHWRITNPQVDVASVSYVVNNLVKVRTATDTTAGDLETKIAPAGRIKERITAAAGDARYQMKNRQETQVTANGTTVAVGTVTPVLSAAALTAISLSSIGSGDTLLETGDECELVDEGEVSETYPITITGNAGNINFKNAGAAATLNWNGPNGSRLVFRWDGTAWIGKGYD